MLLAITRAVSASLAACELTHLPRRPIDVERAVAQHGAYEAALTDLGVRVVRAAPAPELPDAVFIEDTALVLDEVAILTRPGAPSRRAETAGVAASLAPYRPLRHLTAPATLDGGDVLCLGREVFVGESSRSNGEGIAQLQTALEPHGYRVIATPFRGCLHLKSAVTAVGERRLLVNPAWISPERFPGYDAIAVDPGEPAAANALLVDAAVIYPAHFPRTAARLSARRVPLQLVECDELAKAEGGVTCCSLLFDR